jgi:crotonobetaine/carnitine-CoA ligase
VRIRFPFLLPALARPVSTAGDPLARSAHSDVAWHAGAPWEAAPHGSILEIAAGAGATNPGDLAVIFEDGIQITRGEFLSRAQRLARFLTTLLQPGDRVAVMLENRVEFYLIWLAIAANRAVTVSINPGAQLDDCRHVMRDAGCVLAIASGAGREVMEAARSDLPGVREVLYLDEPEPYGLSSLYETAVGLNFATVQAEPGDVVNIYYTSGTTGLPKGCMLDHWWWLRFVDLFVRLYGMTQDDRLLCCLPFYYGDPPWMLLVSLYMGTPLIAMRRFSASRFWNVVDEHRATLLFSIGAIPTFLLNQQPQRRDRAHPLRLAIHLGIPKTLHASMDERWGFPWIEAYGLTETCLIVGVPPHDRARFVGTGSIGIPCPEAAVRVINSAGIPAKPGEPGEIVARAPGMMRAYLNKPEATSEAYRDGWFHTGDLGYVDNNGWLYFVGRQKDIIRRSGENVAAAEVEGTLREHPQVLDAAAVPAPDALRGEEILVYVIPAEGVAPSDIAPDLLIAFCADRLARYKVPRYIVIRSEDFQRTPSMRVQKESLKPESENDLEGVWDRYSVLRW